MPHGLRRANRSHCPAAPKLQKVRPAPPAITSSSASSPPRTVSGPKKPPNTPNFPKLFGKISTPSEPSSKCWPSRSCAPPGRSTPAPSSKPKGGETSATQASVDRGRASAHNSLRRLLNDLRQFQSDRWLHAEVLRDGFDEAYYGIADAHRVLKGLLDNSRLEAQSMGRAPKDLGQTAPLAPAILAAGEEPAPTIRTQISGPDAFAGQP